MPGAIPAYDYSFRILFESVILRSGTQQAKVLPKAIVRPVHRDEYVVGEEEQIFSVDPNLPGLRVQLSFVEKVFFKGPTRLF